MAKPAYDLQEIMMGNYFTKNNIHITRKQNIDGVWFYFMPRIFYSNGSSTEPFITAYMVFPDTFYNEKQTSFESVCTRY